MRLLILASAATLFVTGAAMARDPVRTHHVTHHYHHHVDTSAPAAEGAFPADVLSAHAAHIENLRESGYNPASDFDAVGNLKAN